MHIADLDAATAAAVAAALATMYPRSWPTTPAELAGAVDRAGLDTGEVVLAASAALGTFALSVLTGVPAKHCPPRTYALGWDDVPKALPAAPKRCRSRRRDMRVVTALTLPNPHRAGTKAAAAYDTYDINLTCEEIVAKGCANRDDIRWDISQGYLVVGPPA